MTRTASARLAGLTYLLYMTLGIPAMVLIDFEKNRHMLIELPAIELNQSPPL